MTDLETDSVSSSLDPLPQGSDKTTELNLAGIRVRVKTDATPAVLKQIRQLVALKTAEFEGHVTKGVSTHQVAVLVAHSLAEELVRERERLRILKRRTVESTDRLLERVESYLGS